MKRCPFALLAALVLSTIALTGCATAGENNQPLAGFTALFNGENLEGWTGGTTRNPKDIDALSEADRLAWDTRQLRGITQHWSVDDSELVSDGHEPHLVTDRDYGDFEMWVDWKLRPNGDSGIYLRGCPQVQIWDPTNEDAHRHGSDKGSGGLWNNYRNERFPTELADKPIGEWNRMFVRMVGQYVTVILNDITIVDNVPLDRHRGYLPQELRDQLGEHPQLGPPVFMTGPIHLQTHGSETRFRNVFVREIPAQEANTMFAQIQGDEEGFTSLFNGENLDGWIGATDSYEVHDGAIRCKAQFGGNLVTEEQYDNFIVRLEFKLPPGGNNGLAIRTPNAEVNPANQALELQVLDNTAEKYADLKDYQYHGSAYGITPAHRGYLRPVGEWNDQQVVVNGDHIQAFLNGFKILDTHLQQAAPDHPAAGRTTGHFGFCGHNDPVEFRNIRIKPIEESTEE